MTPRGTLIAVVACLLFVALHPARVFADATPSRGAAIQYADNWATSFNTPTYNSLSPEDCTNFVSQALAAGGRTYLGYPNSTTDDNNWWFHADYNFGYIYSYTRSWSAAANLIHNMTLNDPAFYSLGSYYGQQGGAPSSAAGGDLIYYQWGGGGDHLALLAGWGQDPTSGALGSYVDAHTVNHYHAFWTLAPYYGGWTTTTITVYHVDSGSQGDTTILSTANNYYASTELGYTGGDKGMLRARSGTFGAWEQYGFEPQSDGNYAIRSLAG